MYNNEDRPNVSGLDETKADLSRGHALRESIACLLPKNHVDGIIMIGVLAGIIHYTFTKDTWLLATFLGLLTGGAIERSRQAIRNRHSTSIDGCSD